MKFINRIDTQGFAAPFKEYQTNPKHMVPVTICNEHGKVLFIGYYYWLGFGRITTGHFHLTQPPTGHHYEFDTGRRVWLVIDVNTTEHYPNQPVHLS